MTTVAARLAAANARAASPAPQSKEVSPAPRAKPVHVAEEGELESVVVDGLVRFLSLFFVSPFLPPPFSWLLTHAYIQAVLKIIRHCSTSSLNPPPAGQLLGLATTGVLDISDSFPLPPNHLFPPHISEEQRDKESRDLYRKREDSYETAYANAVSYTAQVLPRMAELNSDATNGVVGFYTGVKDGVVVGQNGALVEALVRYQLGSEGAQQQQAGAGKLKPGQRFLGDRRAPGKGVALVYGSISCFHFERRQMHLTSILFFYI
jgi:hypothetical protein